MHDRPLSSLLRVAAAASVLLIAGTVVSQTSRATERPRANPRWFERLDPIDRRLLQDLVGYAPPAFADDLTWIGGEARTWASLRGRVVLLQTWSNSSSAGRAAIKRAERVAADHADADVTVVLLHTPDGAEHLQRFLERRSTALPLALDSSGGMSDDVGFFRDPTNILVDRNGVVRLVGLNPRGIKDGIEALLAEPADPAAEPPVRNPDEPAPETVFPQFTVPVNNADDLRGQSAPTFFIKRWITREPSLAGKVVVINFWSTECAVCVRLIDQLNALARHFGNQICIISLSEQTTSDFDEGMSEERLSKSDFDHAVALDSTMRMKSAANVRGIPHCLVISRDWIVRWQGHPARLDNDVLSRIVRADRAAGAAGDSRRLERPRRWERVIAEP